MSTNNEWTPPQIVTYEFYTQFYILPKVDNEAEQKLLIERWIIQCQDQIDVLCGQRVYSEYSELDLTKESDQKRAYYLKKAICALLEYYIDTGKAFVDRNFSSTSNVPANLNASTEDANFEHKRKDIIKLLSAGGWYQTFNTYTNAQDTGCGASNVPTVSSWTNLVERLSEIFKRLDSKNNFNSNVVMNNYDVSYIKNLIGYNNKNSFLRNFIIDSSCDLSKVIKLSSTGTSSARANFITINGVEWLLGGSEGESVWGRIQGAITDQVDLMNYFAKYVTLETEQTITSAKKFRRTEDGPTLSHPMISIMNWEGKGCGTIWQNGIQFNNTLSGEEAQSAEFRFDKIATAFGPYGYSLNFPRKSGTIATTDDVSESFNTCFNSAEQSGNKLTLKKENGFTFDYEPEIPAAMTFKGTCLHAELPTSGQKIGDYWKLSNTSGAFVGQCAIWDGTQWTFSSSNISVEQTLQPESTQAVSGKAVSAYMQSFYDSLYPVGSAYFGITAPVVPNGITATWQLEESPNGCAVWVDSNKTPGTVEQESATIEGTALTIKQMPAHNHASQTINGVPKTSTDGNHSHYAKGYHASTQSGSPYVNNWSWDWIESDPAKYTSTNGNHYHTLVTQGGNETHTHTISNIKPNRVFIKVWIRSA